MYLLWLVKDKEFGYTCLTMTLSPCICKHSQFLFIFCLSLHKMGICIWKNVKYVQSFIWEEFC